MSKYKEDMVPGLINNERYYGCCLEYSDEININEVVSDLKDMARDYESELYGNVINDMVVVVSLRTGANPCYFVYTESFKNRLGAVNHA